MSSTLRRLQLTTIALSLATATAACGGGSSSTSTTGSGSGSGSGSETETSSTEGGSTGASSDEFRLSSSDDASQSHGDHASEIVATATQAAMRLFVVDPDTGPTSGVVIKLTGPDGQSYYTHETDSQGYAEVLVPAGQRYDLEYLSLGRRSTTAHVDVPAGPNQDIRLTLRHRPWRPTPRVAAAAPPAGHAEGAPPPAPAPEPGLVLEGILFDTGRATIQAESNPRLDRVVEYMTHMASARIRIVGHTDNVGDPQRNQALSLARAQAVRDYLVSHGIDGSRVEAVGLGDQEPVASNDTEEGRQQNRRIEAVEL